MRFLVGINDDTILTAAGLIEKYRDDAGWLVRLGLERRFNHTAHTGMTVSRAIETSALVISIRPYKTWNPWSRVIGHASGTTIFVNTRKLDLPLYDRIENLMHESLHLLGYSHKGNRVTAYNLETVPYKVARIFKEYIQELHAAESARR